MLPRNRWFIAAGLLYALIGGLIGLIWLAAPGWISGNVARAHAHLMLVGFIGMTIFGVGLHALPRFSGRPLFSERLADGQFVLVNLGLLAMTAGWLSATTMLVTAGGSIAWIGLALFALNVIMTVRPWGRRG